MQTEGAINIAVRKVSNGFVVDISTDNKGFIVDISTDNKITKTFIAKKIKYEITDLIEKELLELEGRMINTKEDDLPF